MNLKKLTAFTFILLLILFVNSKGFSALDITVKNREGKPAVANVQIFPGDISPDSDKKPVPPPVPRADGLVGFKTKADGKVSVKVPPGDYTVVAFSQLDEHRFSLVEKAVAPGNVELSAARASAVTIFATNDEGKPLEVANIFFRPNRRVRGWVGSIDNDGYRLAYVSPGTYHVVLISSGDSYYLVLPNQKVNLPSTRVNIDAANLVTAKIDFDLPERVFPAIYEVLETELTYEYIETIEKEIGYDATRTNEFALISGMLTLSANLTYWLNIEFVTPTGDAYEIRPSPKDGILLKEDTYHIGNTGEEKFDIKVAFDKQAYHSGETATVSYEFLDNRGNKLNRLFDYSGARLIFPFVTVQNPDGLQIASNPHTENFFGFSFNLPPSANVGKYSLRIYFDAKLYGKIAKTVTFDVVSYPDEKPKISNITVPKEAEAGAEIIFSANIEDDKVIDSITLILSHEDGRQQSFQTLRTQQKVSFRAEIPDEFVLPGQLRWEILVKDSTGNETTQSGQMLIRDTTAPLIEHKPIETIEIGVDVILQARITDNACIADAAFSYKFNDENLHMVKFERSDLQYRTTLPAMKQFGVVSYFIQSTDGAGNVAYFPASEDVAGQSLAATSRKFVTAHITDTTPPMIYHMPLTNLIDAVVEDNNAVADVKLYYKSPGAGKFKESAMAFNGNAYQATIPTLDFPNGVEYFIEASDEPDQNNISRKSRVPEGTHLIQPPDVLPLEVELLPRSSPESPLEIEVGTSQLFAIQDKSGNPVKAVWTSTGSIGRIDQAGYFTAEHKIRGDGFGRVIVNVVKTTTYSMKLDKRLPLQTTAYVKLKPGQPSRIAIVPQFARVSAGNNQYFHAVLMDDFDNEISNSKHIGLPLQWRVSGGVGKIDEGVLTAEKVGAGSVEVFVENLRAVSEVQVGMGKIKRIEISPNNSKTRAGEQQQFTAFGYDAMDNSLPIAPIWTVRGGIGNIKNGTFTGGKIGDGEVIAILGNLQASSTVTVSAGELNSIDVVPFIDYLPLSTKKQKYHRQFTAFGWDAGGNPVPIEHIRWNTDDAAGTIDETGLFTSTDGQNAMILTYIVTNGSVFAFGKSESGREFSDKSVVVIQEYPPEVPKKIAVYVENFGMELDKITMSVGERERFEVTGSDKEGQRTLAAGGVPGWEALGDIGYITPDGIFTATRPGVGAIVVTDGGFTAKITVEVTPGMLKSLVVKPEILTLNAGSSYQLTAYGYDEFGNSVHYNELQWFVKGDIASVTDGRVTAIRPGAALISAKSGDAEGYSQLFIQPGKLRELKISVQKGTPLCSDNQQAPILIASGQRVQFIAKGYDIAGNELTIMPNWHVSDGVGEIAFDGSFIAMRAGEGVVTSCVGNVCAIAKVSVVDSLDSTSPLEIYPNPLNIIAGASQQFVALGTENPSWHVVGNIGTIDEQSGFFRAGEKPGTGSVVLTVYSFRRNASLAAETKSGENIATVSVSVYETTPISELFIIPQETQITLRIGERQVFRALALTDDNRMLQVLPIFSATNDIGYIDAMGNFTAQRVGEGNVTATLGALEAACPVNVVSQVPTHAEIISRQSERFELVYTGDSKNNTVPWEITWLLPDGSRLNGREIDYQHENIEPQLATVSEPFYTLTAIATTPHLNMGQGKTVIVSNVYTSPAKTAPFALHVMPPAIRTRAGDTARIAAICSDSNGNLVCINPTWALEGIPNLGTISDNGLFMGNKVGFGNVICSPAHLPTCSPVSFRLPTSSNIPVDILPNRPVFAMLQPNMVFFPPKDRAERRFELLVFDARNNPVELPAEQIQWKLIGEIGDVDNAGNFIPLAENEEEENDENGELTAFIPEHNLFARAKIRLLARHNRVKRIRVEPTEIDVIRGKTHHFRAIPLDYNDSPLPSDTLQIHWAVFRSNDEELKDSITSGGTLKSANASVGEQLKVLAHVETEYKTLSAEASVEIVAGALDTIKITNSTGETQLKVGQRIELSVSGLDAYGNDVEVRPMWWATSGEVAKSNSQASFVAIEPGDITIFAEQNGIAGKTEVSVAAQEEDEIKITALSATENAGQTPDNPLQVESGSTILLTARNRGEIINPAAWVISPPNGVMSEHGRFSAQKSGKYKITATFSLSPGGTEPRRYDYNADFFVEVVAGKLASIQVTPPVVSVLTKEVQQFHTKGFDAFGNEVPEQKVRWDVTGGVGTIDESGLFTPAKTQVGTSIYGTVVATPPFEDLPAELTELPSGSASVTVVSKLGPPVSITLKAEPLVVQAGGESVLTISGADEDGNPITNFQNYFINFLPSVTSLANRWVYTAPQKLPIVRDITLTAETQVSSKRLTSDIILTLIPAPLAELSIEPKSVTLSAGEQQRFQLSAFDVFSNPISLENIAWQVSTSLGKLSDQRPNSVTYVAQKAGNVELIAESNNHITTAAAIQIIPSSTVKLSIEPPSATITAGAEKEFVVIGFDVYDNKIEHLKALWQIESDQIGNLQTVPDQPASKRFLASKAGESLLIVQYDEPTTGKTLTAQASIKVTPGKLKHLQIHLAGKLEEAPFKLISGGEYIFKAEALDEYGNELFPKIDWKLMGDIGLLENINDEGCLSESQCILFSATFVGTGTLIAMASDQNAEAAVEVAPYSSKVGREGGFIESPANASIFIPEGALRNETEISISIIKAPGPVVDTPGYTDTQRISDVIDFQPRGLIFKKPVKLTLSCAKPKIGRMEDFTSKLSLYFWDVFQEKWVRSGGKTENQRVTEYVSHLAPFAIMESVAADSVPPQTAEPLDILSVKFTPEVFYAPENNRLTIEYTLAMKHTNDAEVTIKIFAWLGTRLVATPLNAQLRDAGKHAEQWDGTDENGRHLRNGRYVLVVIARAGDETVAKKKLLVVCK